MSPEPRFADTQPLSPLANKHLALAVCLYQDAVPGHCSPNLHHTLKGFQSRDQEWGCLLWENPGRTGLQKIFSGEDFMSLMSRKALKSWRGTSAPDQQQTFAKECAWLRTAPFTKIVRNTDHPPPIFGAVPQSSLKCHLAGYSPHFAHNKT